MYTHANTCTHTHTHTHTGIKPAPLRIPTHTHTHTHTGIKPAPLCIPPIWSTPKPRFRQIFRAQLRRSCSTFTQRVPRARRGQTCVCFHSWWTFWRTSESTYKSNRCSYINLIHIHIYYEVFMFMCIYYDPWVYYYRMYTYVVHVHMLQCMCAIIYTIHVHVH